MPFRVVCLVVFASLSLSAQSQPKPATMSDIEASLAKYRLAKCEASLTKERDYTKQMREWADVNVPKHETLLKDYNQLKQENEQLQARTSSAEATASVSEMWTRFIALFMMAVGAGVGIFMAFRAWKILRQAWPWSPARKQLMILILGSIWVTGAAVIVANDSDLARHPVNMLFTGLLYSIPALAFSGTGVWWFARVAKEAQEKPKDKAMFE